MTNHNRPPINEILSAKRPSVAAAPAEGAATIVLVKPILERNGMGHLAAFDRLDVLSFTRGPHSLTCEFGGKRREIFYANIVELLPKTG